MVECCLDRDRPFGFLVGRGGVFLQQLRLGFRDKVKAFSFCNLKKTTIVISPYKHV